ncbi:LSU ribosomal protein L3p (L3e) [Candidatus Vidania fulgoroideae]|nr:LSU ribosomal protein L3p (L3e) [Candidatus Vidania fulgoroideae]
MIFKDRTSNVYLSGEHILATSFIKKDELGKLEIGKKYVLTSKSKGKGFSGVIKRHNFSGGNKTHGNSKAHRKPGSIGMCQDPGRVFKGKKMAGHMGDKKNTKKNLLIYFSKKRMIFIGNVPGSRKSEIRVKNDFKHYKKK